MAKHFIGGFLETPEKLSHADVPVSQLSLLNLINTLNEPDVELEKISSIILADNLLSYKLLLVINSPMFRGVKKISSIQEAIVRFGFANLKKWGAVLSLSSFSHKTCCINKIDPATCCALRKVSGKFRFHQNRRILYHRAFLNTRCLSRYAYE